MQFKKIAVLLAGASVASAAVIQRDINDINAAITTASAAVDAFNTAVGTVCNDANPTLGEAAGIQVPWNDLNTKLNALTAALNADKGAKDATESGQIQAQLPRVAFQVIAGLSQVKSCAPKFIGLGVGNLVVANLGTLTTNWNNFLTALNTRLIDSDWRVDQQYIDQIKQITADTYTAFGAAPPS